MPTQQLQLLIPDPTPKARRLSTRPSEPISLLHEEEIEVLERLRQAARTARGGRWLALSQAHRALGCPGAAAGGAEMVVRVLGEVIGERPRFHAPGSSEISFDEAWLVRLHAAQAAGDKDSMALLTGRRVPVALRRAFLDLLRAL